ncbi:MAG: 23S rRNA (uracil(1939)-C(5))-methyltransferase RlmD [Paludibacteraceae bacterium]|nr:23S rRNA (uracil(1939)-C(5))-methyltransferase RlmD [Paludibacteraceae bacterium]
MSKKKALPLLQDIEITGVAAEGKALCRIDDCVVFVPFCVPGDVVDLQVTRKKHSFMEARVETLKKPSPVRCEARCKHFGECGGCKWQILPYSEQLKYKQQQVVDNLTRIGKVELPEISPILGSKHEYEYRNKLEFSFSDKKWLSWDAIREAGGLENVDKSYALGFHAPGSFDKVLDIEECYLMPDINNQIRNFLREYGKEHGLTFYNEREHSGFLRSLILRSNAEGEVMVTIAFAEDRPQERDALLEALHSRFEKVTSIIWVLNEKFNDTIGDLELHTYFGQDHIIETMENLRFKVGPKSFYQTNTEQAYELYKVARAYAGLTGNELVYDLYTGTGTIAQFVASQARQVIGIEYVPEAIEDAKINAAFNGIENTLFFAGDMKKVLDKAFIEQYGRPDVIITDPPRAGMDEDVVKTILFAAPKRIVYVSCNPATQARDLQLLDAEYQVKAVQPVDMFPHTQHVENVVLLEKR